MHGIVHDITPEHLARQEAKESEQLLQAIIDNSSSAIYAKDLDGRYRADA